MKKYYSIKNLIKETNKYYHFEESKNNGGWYNVTLFDYKLNQAQTVSIINIEKAFQFKKNLELFYKEPRYYVGISYHLF